MLLTLGLSHATAPLRVREQLSFSEAELPEALRRLRALPGVDEVLLLSTCNRTELYAVGGVPASALARALGELRGVDPDDLAPSLRALADGACARHILRVACGLESMIVGESQILGQVRRAFAAARAEGTAGPVLHRLLQTAIAAGRRVRAETALGRTPASIPHAVAALCRRQWGSLRDRAVGVVGAGEMAALTARLFAAGGARLRVVANRTVAHARLLARRYGAEAVGLDGLAAALPDLDALVVAAGAARPIVPASLLEAASPARPLLVADLGVPRGVDPAAGRLPQVTLVDLDALAPDGTGGPPPEAIAAAEAIVEEGLRAFTRWTASRAAAPVIAALHRRAERIVEGELARARGRLSRLDERERQAVRSVVEGALRKLLHGPFVRLRARAGDEAALALARELFDLPEGEMARE